MSHQNSIWTHKSRFLPPISSPLTDLEQAAYFYGCLGLDGLFTEFPDRMREVSGEDGHTLSLSLSHRLVDFKRVLC
jgi:hypothetical protein